MILNRIQFADYWNNLTPELGLGNPGSVLWTLEKSGCIDPSQWFIKVKPLKLSTQGATSEYHTWNESILIGNVLCYSSSDETSEEWWGFTHYEDVLIWKLRWEGQ
jgi:hypothetical protein